MYSWVLQRCCYVYHLLWLLCAAPILLLWSVALAVLRMKAVLSRHSRLCVPASLSSTFAALTSLWIRRSPCRYTSACSTSCRMCAMLSSSRGPCANCKMTRVQRTGLISGPSSAVAGYAGANAGGAALVAGKAAYRAQPARKTLLFWFCAAEADKGAHQVRHRARHELHHNHELCAPGPQHRCVELCDVLALASCQHGDLLRGHKTGLQSVCKLPCREAACPRPCASVLRAQKVAPRWFRTLWMLSMSSSLRRHVRTTQHS